MTSANVTSTGTLVATPCRVRALHYRAGAAAGTIVLKDGGASGTVKLTIHPPASAAFAGSLSLPGDGILFGTDVHATLTQADSCTVVYE